jgi:CheY-like chemotaxis protein
MGGTIDVREQAGKGTRFQIHLELPIATKEQVKNSERRLEDKNTAILKDKKILVAEDHPMNREIIEKHLQAGQYAGGHCSRRKSMCGTVPTDAGKLLRCDPYGCANADHEWLEAARQIRDIGGPYPKEIQIIAMTADAFAEDREATREAGMNEHLSKRSIKSSCIG